MRRRIVYLISQLGLGGQEHQLFNILDAMDRERYRPAVVAWNFNERDFYVAKIKKLGVPIHALPYRTRIAKLKGFSHLVRQLGAEVVHSYSFYTNFAAWVATLNGCAAPIGSIQSGFTRGRREAGLAIGGLSARWPRHQICNSHVAAEEAQDACRFLSPKCLHVVVNGVNLEQFYPSPLLQGSSPNIVAVGSLLPIKRWDLLVAAAAELRSRGLGFRLKIAGNGPLRDSLSWQIRQLGLDDYVVLLGRIEDIPNLFRQSAFVVHTSDVEGCPNALIEAMSSGRAVVATDAGDVPFIVDDGVTGFVVRRGDQEALVERIAELIGNPGLRVRMGKAGRAKAEREFTLERMVEQILSAYRAAGWADN